MLTLAIKETNRSSFGGIGGLTAAAETVGSFTVTGGTLGTDYTYAKELLV